MAIKSSMSKSIIEQGKQILQEQGVNYNKWREEALYKAKMEILTGTNKDWENQLLEAEMLEVVLKHSQNYFNQSKSDTQYKPKTEYSAFPKNDSQSNKDSAINHEKKI